MEYDLKIVGVEPSDELIVCREKVNQHEEPCSLPKYCGGADVAVFQVILLRIHQ